MTTNFNSCGKKGEEPHFIRSYYLTLRRNFLQFRKYVNRTLENNCLQNQIGNADQTPVYFDMPSNYTIHYTGAKSVPTKTSGNEMM
jgi:hypothetical protein